MCAVFSACVVVCVLVCLCSRVCVVIAELYEAFAAVYHFKHYTDATLPIAPCRAAVAILLERHEAHDVIIHRLGVSAV